MSAIAPVSSALKPIAPLSASAAAASPLAPALSALPHIFPGDQGEVNQQTFTPPAQTPNPYEGPPTSMLTPGQMLARNPQLPSKAGTGTDAQYAADEAMLREQIRQQYNSVLSQLGYKDDSGNLTMGNIELDAYRQQRDLSRQQGLAVDDVTHQMQREGTLFSGYRGTQQGLAERPFISALADIGVDLPRRLSDTYDQAQNLINDYQLQQSMLLLQAADRYAAKLANSPTGGGGSRPGDSTGGTAPPPNDPTAPPPPTDGFVGDPSLLGGYIPPVVTPDGQDATSGQFIGSSGGLGDPNADYTNLRRQGVI
jgi:hypothetical protein